MTTDATQRLPRTRILATLGPASWEPEVMRCLVKAGASGFRLNFSHGRHDILKDVIARVRRLGDELNRPLALVADLAGPKLRTGPLEGDAEILLTTGEEVTLSPDFECTREGHISVDASVFSGNLEPGTRILLNDGKLEIQVVSVGQNEVRAFVVHGGLLGSHKGVNLPGVHLDIPSLSEKDVSDLEFALEHDVEFIALSFVREPRDIVDVKRRIAMKGRSAGVIAKIELPEAVDNLEALLEVSDGIMVARGDLGVELGVEILPVVQKQIIQTARRRGKLVATATQMLGSMTTNPRPTRAEASDVANAVFDGSDVVMLSEETAIGKFPCAAVETMCRILRYAEDSDAYRELASLHRPAGLGIAQATMRGACVAAAQLEARAIIPFSVSLTPTAESLDDLYVDGLAALIDSGALHDGDMVVLVTGSVVSGIGANTMKIYRIGTAGLAEDKETRRRLRDLVSQSLTGF